MIESSCLHFWLGWAIAFGTLSRPDISCPASSSSLEEAILFPLHSLPNLTIQDLVQSPGSGCCCLMHIVGVTLLLCSSCTLAVWGWMRQPQDCFVSKVRVKGEMWVASVCGPFWCLCSCGMTVTVILVSPTISQSSSHNHLFAACVHVCTCMGRLLGAVVWDTKRKAVRLCRILTLWRELTWQTGLLTADRHTTDLLKCMCVEPYIAR